MTLSHPEDINFTAISGSSIFPPQCSPSLANNGVRQLPGIKQEEAHEALPLAKELLAVDGQRGKES